MKIGDVDAGETCTGRYGDEGNSVCLYPARLINLSKAIGAWSEIGEAVVAGAVRNCVWLPAIEIPVGIEIEEESPSCQTRFTTVHESIAIEIVDFRAADAAELEVAKIDPAVAKAAGDDFIRWVGGGLYPARLQDFAHSIRACGKSGK